MKANHNHSVAEMERNVVSEHTRAGLNSAKAQGRIGGRKPGLTSSGQKRAKQAVSEYIKYKENRTMTIDDICNTVGVSIATLYKYLRL